MSARSSIAIALMLGLSACTAERAPVVAAPLAADQPAVDTRPASPPATDASDTKSSDMPPAITPDGDDHPATFIGYGDIKFGTAAIDMEKAWGGELKTLGKDDNPNCYFMTPKWVKAPAELNFMLSEGKFVRYGTKSEKFVAPGGGKVGMHEAELQALYKQALQATPHKYVDGGKYLSIAASGVGPGKLVFETDAHGIVTEWRVGLSPEIDNVEGCS